jgi:hypothetical protein
VVAHKRQRLAGVAGVEVQLPAAGLRLRERHLLPEAFEQGDRGPAHVREQRVHQARDQQRDPHRARPPRACSRGHGSALAFEGPPLWQGEARCVRLPHDGRACRYVSSMNLPTFDEVLEGLGDKTVSAIVSAVDRAAQDLQSYRTTFPSWVTDHTERGLANWIHDRIWACLTRELDGHPEVILSGTEPTREIMVGINYRLRIKRHHEDGEVRTYPTQTALEFYMQGTQETFPGMEELRLAGGYNWDPELRAMGEAVLSLRDSLDNIIWFEPLPRSAQPPTTVADIRPPVLGPKAPSVEVAEDRNIDGLEGDAQ